MSFERVARDGWASALGLARGGLDDIRGVTVLVDPPALVAGSFEGHLVFAFGDASVITTSAAREPELREHIGDRSPAEVFEKDFVASLARDGWVVLGPSRHAYVDRARFVPFTGAGQARRLGPRDEADVAALRDAVDPAEWSEGGFGPDVEVMWGLSSEGVLVAAGNMTPFAGSPADVGIVTHPDHRGRGHGAALASAMTDAALDDVEVVRYRALRSNVHSLAIADKLGFVACGSNYAVRPPR